MDVEGLQLGDTFKFFASLYNSTEEAILLIEEHWLYYHDENVRLESFNRWSSSQPELLLPLLELCQSKLQSWSSDIVARFGSLTLAGDDGDFTQAQLERVTLCVHKLSKRIVLQRPRDFASDRDSLSMVNEMVDLFTSLPEFGSKFNIETHNIIPDSFGAEGFAKMQPDSLGESPFDIEIIGHEKSSSRMADSHQPEVLGEPRSIDLHSSASPSEKASELGPVARDKVHKAIQTLIESTHVTNSDLAFIEQGGDADHFQFALHRVLHLYQEIIPDAEQVLKTLFQHILRLSRTLEMFGPDETLADNGDDYSEQSQFANDLLHPDLSSSSIFDGIKSDGPSPVLEHAAFDIPSPSADAAQSSSSSELDMRPEEPDVRSRHDMMVHKLGGPYSPKSNFPSIKNWLNHPTRLLWGMLSLTLECSFETATTCKLVLQWWQALVKTLPRVFNYPRLCNVSDTEDLQHRIADLYCSVLAYSRNVLQVLRLYTAELEINEDLTRTMETMIQDAVVKSIAVDKQALSEHLLSFGERSEYEPVSLGTPAEHMPISPRLGLNEASPLSERKVHPALDIRYDAPSRLLKSYFRGRHTELQKMVNLLIKPYTGTTSYCVLSGVDEIGKTQVALRYAKSISECMPTLSVFWLSAASSSRLQRGIYLLLEQFGDNTVKYSNHDARLDAVKWRLTRLGKEGGQPWLLIIDDVRKEPAVSDMLRACLPLDAPWGQIILTVRSRYYEKMREILDDNWNLNHIELTVPDIDTAAAMLIAAARKNVRSNTSSFNAQIRRIANLVECHPLPITQIGEYLGESEGSAPQILDEVSEWIAKGVGAYQLPPWPNLSSSVKKALAATLHLVIERFSRKHPDAYHALSTLVFFDLDNIPLDLLLGTGLRKDFTATTLDNPSPNYEQSEILHQQRHDQRKVSGHAIHLIADERSETPDIMSNSMLLSMLNSADGTTSITGELLSTSLVSRITPGKMPNIRIYERVRDLVIAKLYHEESHIKHLGDAVDLLLSARNSLPGDLDDPSVWQKCSILAPHFYSLFLYLRRYAVSIDAFESLTKDFGWYYFAMGDFIKAEECYKILMSKKPVQDKLVREERLSRIYVRIGKFDEAMDLLQPVASRTNYSLTSFTIEELRAADALANTHYVRGKFASARILYTKILQEQKRRISLRSMSVLQTINTHEGLGNVYHHNGEPGEAIKMYEEVLRLRKQSDGMPKEPDRLTIEEKQSLGWKFIALQRTNYNRARLLRDQGDVRQAERLFKEVWEEYRAILGKHHPDTLSVAASLARMWAHQRDKLLEAQKLVMIILEEPKHPTESQENQVPRSIVQCYAQWTLGYVLGRLHQFVEAEAAFQKAIAGYDALLTPRHLYSCYVRRDYSVLVSGQRGIRAGIRVLEGVEGDEVVVGSPAAAMLAKLYADLALTLPHGERQDFQVKAEKLVQATLQIQIKSEASKRDTAFTYWVFGKLCNDRGKYPPALRYYKEAFEGYSKVPGAGFGKLTELAKEYATLLRKHGGSRHAKKESQSLRADESRLASFVQVPDPVPPLESFDSSALLVHGFYPEMNLDLNFEVISTA